MNGLLRVIFLRGSPERIHYSRALFIVLLFTALVMSAASQWLFFRDHLVFVILRVFAELTLFMLAMVVATGQMARFRLARMMLVLVAISVLMDAVLTLLSVITDALQAPAAAYILGSVALYGAANAVRWGLSCGWGKAALSVGVYLAGVVLLNQAFRGLYNVMAS